MRALYVTDRVVDMSTVRFMVRAYAEPAAKIRPALSTLLWVPELAG